MRLNGVLPKAHGIAPKTWANLRSNFDAALKAAGVTVRSAEVKLAGPWKAAAEAVRASATPQLMNGLGRLLRFAQARGVTPEEVDDDLVDAFEAALAASSLRKDPETAAREAVRLWNRACDTVPGWPGARLSRRTSSKHYALGWDAFPASLARDVDAFLTRCSAENLYTTDGPRTTMNATTRDHRKGQFQRFASALVHAGVPAAALAGLTDLVTPARIPIGIDWLIARRDGAPPGPGIREMAVGLRHAARWHVHDEDAVALLDRVIGRVGGSDGAMAEKNRRRAEQFHDEVMVRRLVELPDVLIAPAAKMSPEDAARTWEKALAIALFTQFPLRRGEMVRLRLDRDVEIRKARGRVTVRIALPARLVKNGQGRFFTLSPHTAEMLILFRDDHRPVLVTAPSPYLFSKRSGDAPMAASSLYSRIVRETARHVGVTLSPHNFRHIVGVIHLSHQPGDLDTVRRILGHGSVETTRKYYDFLEVDAANRAWGETLDAKRKKNK